MKEEVTMDEPAQLAEQILNPRSPLNIDALLDAVTAFVQDCSFALIRRSRNIDVFVNRFNEAIKLISNLRLKGTDFQCIQVIGRGSFGEVQLVRHKKSKKVYAMKVLNKNEMLMRTDAAFFWEERDIMAHANSDWIVHLYYAFQDNHFLYMVMEYMPGGDLVNLMQNYEVSEKWARFYTAELVMALDVLHKMGYIHRDVKPDNMLISRAGHVKLADFGTCLRTGPDGKVKCSTAVGTPDYLCPEVLDLHGKEATYGPEVDWWSVGIFLYELIFGETPFYADSLAATYNRIQHYSTELAFPDDVEVSDKAKDLMKRLLSNPKTRLGVNGVEEIKSHPFFVNDEWTFENIRKAVPPVVPDLKGDDDTSNFEDVDKKKSNPADNFQIPKSFAGNQLPFIGFTYLNELGPIAAIQKKASEAGEKQVEAVLEQYSRLSTIDPQIESEKRMLEKELAACQVNVKDLTRKLEMEKDEMLTKTKLITSLESQLSLKAKVEERAKELERQLTESTEKCRNHAENEERARKIQSELHVKLNSQMEITREMEERLRKNVEEEASMTETIEQLKSQANTERENCRRAQGVVNELEEKTESLRAELAATRERELALKCELSKITESLAADASKNDNNREAINNNIRLTDELQAALKKIDQISSELEKEIRKSNVAQTDAQNAHAQLTSFQNVINTLENDLKKIQDEKKRLEQQVHNLSSTNRIMLRQLEDIREQFETECSFLNIYKTEVNAMTEELMEKTSRLEQVEEHQRREEERTREMLTQLESERLARRMAEENLSTTDKEKTMLEVEVRQLMQRHEKELMAKDEAFKLLYQQKEELKNSLNDSDQNLLSSKTEQTTKKLSNDKNAIRDLESQLEHERMMKITAVNKLEELMAHRDIVNGGKKGKVSRGDMRRREKRIAELEKDLKSERQKYEEQISQMSKENEQLKVALVEEERANESLRTDLEAYKHLETFMNEQKKRERGEHEESAARLERGSVSSLTSQPIFHGSSTNISESDFNLESAVSIRVTVKRRPNWRECFAVFSSAGLCFYNTQADHTPFKSIYAEWLCHVRHASAADIRCAGETQLPRIFQIFYDEGKKYSSRASSNVDVSASSTMNGREEKVDKSLWNGHELLELTFHMPTNCDLCVQPLSNLLRPPPAFECKLCRMRFHRSHLGTGSVPQCKRNVNTENLLIMAPNAEICVVWVQHLKAFIKYNNSTLKSGHFPRSSSSMKAATKPPNVSRSGLAASEGSESPAPL